MVRWTEDDPGAGEVAELEDLARRVDTLAEQMWHFRKNVWAASDPVTEEAWAGQAGDEWREQVEQALPGLQTVVDVAVDTSEALTTYARHVGEIASEAVQVRARHAAATAAMTAAMAQLTLINLQTPKPVQINNMVTDQQAVKKAADKRRIANASLEDAQDDKRAAERAMEELADRRRGADRRVIEALGPVEVSEWEHIGQAVITAGFTSPRQLGMDPMGAAMMRLSAGVYSGTADRATGDMATVMAYRLMDEWMNSLEAHLLKRVGREHPDLLNELLRAGIAAKEDGDWVKGLQGLGTGIRNHRHSAEVAAAIGIIYTKFKPQGPWDAKPHLAAQFGAVDEPTRWLPTNTGKEIYYDVFGNIQYGAMMSRFGVESELALAASHMPGAGQAGEGADDDPFILLGYDLAAKYPKGPTEAQFEAWFNGLDVQKALKEMRRIR